MSDAFITRTSHFLPGDKIPNEEMEDYLGMIKGRPSRTRSIVLRQNKITGRYYALDKGGVETHTNAEMTSLAISKLFKNGEYKEIDLLCCGTSTPDHLLPSHAVMVHGSLSQTKPIEVVSTSGVCCSGMHALKYAYNSVRIGDKSKAVVTASERISSALRNWQYEDEANRLEELEADQLIAFEKEFLRWMLSDGAAAFYIQDTPNESSISLKIDWLDAVSFANQEEVCMHMGGEKLDGGELKSFYDFRPQELSELSVMSVKQDAKLLGKSVIQLGVEQLANSLNKRNISEDEVDYFLPHISSFYFESKLSEGLINAGLNIPNEKWFTNLAEIGNVGSASIFLIIDELFNSGKLKKGEKILLSVPESARFSYVTGMLTVC